ncbi:MAG: serine dehydratase beta chain, partial [Rhabdochlamydiaceae bacterium]
MVSLFQLFSIGIGPSSSHTVGPMRAAHLFATLLQDTFGLENISKITAELYGSLAMTGIGHGTDKAIFLGLEGETPEAVDPDLVDHRVARVQNEKNIYLLGSNPIAYDLIFHKGKRLPYHSNALRFKAYDLNGKLLINQLYYSVGGGFVVPHEHIEKTGVDESVDVMPYVYSTCEELLTHCRENNMMIYEVVMENEKALRTESQIRKGILRI